MTADQCACRQAERDNLVAKLARALGDATDMLASALRTMGRNTDDDNDLLHFRALVNSAKGETA